MKLNIEEIEKIIRGIEKLGRITDLIFLTDIGSSVRATFHYEDEVIYEVEK